MAADAIRHRIEVYRAETADVIGVYRERGLLVEVDAVGTIEEVRDRISDSLDAHLMP